MHNLHDYSGTLIGLVHSVSKKKKNLPRFAFLRLQVEEGRKDSPLSTFNKANLQQ
jgi:hypothetical protein